MVNKQPKYPTSSKEFAPIDDSEFENELNDVDASDVNVPDTDKLKSPSQDADAGKTPSQVGDTVTPSQVAKQTKQREV